MAEKIILAGVKPWDGEYPLDIEEEPLTTLEWRWIKKISGYLPLTMQDGLAGADPDLVCALAVVALRRGGKIGKEQALAAADRLADIPFDGAAIQLVFEADEDEAAEGDADPPAQSSSSDAPPPSE